MGKGRRTEFGRDLFPSLDLAWQAKLQVVVVNQGVFNDLCQVCKSKGGLKNTLKGAVSISRKAKLNRRLYFPDWEGVLSRSSLLPNRHESMAITIRWNLRACFKIPRRRTPPNFKTGSKLGKPGIGGLAEKGKRSRKERRLCKNFAVHPAGEPPVILKVFLFRFFSIFSAIHLPDFSSTFDVSDQSGPVVEITISCTQETFRSLSP
ncbi:MAG: hypothetical protein O2960_26685 [Verrucomicrobia bacterium]|nr:hypothetical protein [Verrucomicrobiota bacterium]